MFKVTFMVNDNKLGNALQGLAGIAAEPPLVQPVMNAVSKNGRVQTQFEGGMKGLIRQHVLNENLKTLTPSDIKMIITKAGFAEMSAPSLINDLLKARALKRIDRGVYECKFN